MPGPRPVKKKPIQSDNVSNLLELRVLNAGAGRIVVWSLAFSHNSRILAVGRGDPDYKIELWQVSDGTLLGLLSFGWPGAAGLAFHPDGNTLVAVSGNFPRFSLWSLGNQAFIRNINFPVGYQPGLVCMTPSGQTIATGGFDGKVLFWDWNNGDPRLRSTLPAQHKTFITSLAFSRDGSYLASGDSNGLFCLWRVGFDLVPELHFSVQASSGWASCSFDGAGAMLAAANLNGDLYLVNVRDANTVAKLKQAVPPPTGQMVACDFAPKVQLVASVEYVANPSLEFWDASNQTLLFSKGMYCNQVLFSPNGQVIAVVRRNPNGPDIPTIWGLP